MWLTTHLPWRTGHSFPTSLPNVGIQKWRLHAVLGHDFSVDNWKGPGDRQWAERSMDVTGSGFGNSWSAERLFAGPGETRERLRRTDWAATPLGPVETWSVE